MDDRGGEREVDAVKLVTVSRDFLYRMLAAPTHAHLPRQNWYPFRTNARDKQQPYHLPVAAVARHSQRDRRGFTDTFSDLPVYILAICTNIFSRYTIAIKIKYIISPCPMYNVRLAERGRRVCAKVVSTAEGRGPILFFFRLPNPFDNPNDSNRVPARRTFTQWRFGGFFPR